MLNFFEQRDWEISNFKDVIKSHIYKNISTLDIEAYLSKEPLSYQDRTKGDKKTLRPGDKWGDLFDCAWFHFTGSVPAEGEGKHLVLLIDVNGEACVFDENGTPVRGLTNGSSCFEIVHGMPGKRVLQFSKPGKKGQSVDLWVDAGCNDLFGRLSKDGRVEQADIAICNNNIRALYYDYWVLSELTIVLDKESARYARVMKALYDSMQILQSITDENVEAARKILAVELERKNCDPCMTLSAMGNAHIDLAWLWPMRESFRKTARTFSTVLELMDRYPEYIFGASQPQLFVWMKDMYPELYRKMKEKIIEGRWEVHGGNWVEMDTNMTSGESLIRQILYGKRFFMEEFGIDVKSLWLPDAFGFSGALPQIMKICGLDYFMTQKLAWNGMNRFPHYTFRWKGIDGTAVLAHMLPEDTYISHAGPRAISKAEKNYAQKDISDRALLLFGIGDGGGGPGAEHLEQLRRLKNLSGLVPVEQESSADFFKRIDRDDIDYPEWEGEMYLEKHQGTFTTQAKNKKYNRLLEIKLHDLEFFSCIANLNGLEYPTEKIDEIWKEVLLYQFHDILPGSSIDRVHDESVERYEILAKEVDDMTETALDSISQNIDASNVKNPLAVFNTFSWKRSEWMKHEDSWIKADVDPMGWTVLDMPDSSDEFSDLVAEEQLLENDRLKLSFADDGSLISMLDKVNNYSCIKENQKANILRVYIDKGDAWDMQLGYRDIPSEKFELGSVKSYIDGPTAVIEQEYKYNLSTIKQRIVLTSGSNRVDFITDVDWNESFKMLRAEFPINVHTDHASCDMQFGYIKYPTHRNTSWDEAKYEICAHKYVDVSQSNYGVALLNDSKYGFRVVDNVLDINLLRSPDDPGKTADKGKQQFTYSLYPHKGNHIEGNVAQAAYELNNPLIAKRIPAASKSLNKSMSFLVVDDSSVIIDTVKKAQDSSDIIVRLYEANGGSCTVNLDIELPLNNVWLADGMENKLQELKSENGKVELTFRPWEIKTLSCSLAK